MKVKVDVLGTLSLIVPTIYVDVKQDLKKKKKHTDIHYEEGDGQKMTPYSQFHDKRTSEDWSNKKERKDFNHINCKCKNNCLFVSCVFTKIFLGFTQN